MAVRKPIVRVSGPTTANLVDVWGSSLASVQLRDAEGYESDTCTLTFRVTPPFPALPPKGTTYTVYVGWSAAGMGKSGVYTIQRTSLGGSPDGGCELVVECRAADYIDKAKSVDSGHWDDKTVGEIVDDVAKQLGLSAQVDPALRSIKIPYRARMRQEAMGFLSDLADDVGGAVKAAGGKIVMTERGAGKAAGGGSLPTFRLALADAYDFSFDFEPRGDSAESTGSWYDEESGTWKREMEQGTGKGRLDRPHPWPSKDEAKRGAKAKHREHKRKSASGSVSCVGDPSVVAGSPVQVSGFGPDADGTAWIAASIDHTIDPGGEGWVMTITLETKPQGKSGGADGDADADTSDLEAGAPAPGQSVG